MREQNEEGEREREGRNDRDRDSRMKRERERERERERRVRDREKKCDFWMCHRIAFSFALFFIAAALHDYRPSFPIGPHLGR